MNLQRKIEMAQQAISSITRSDGTHHELVLQAAEILREHIRVEIDAARDRRQQKLDAALRELEQRSG